MVQVVGVYGDVANGGMNIWRAAIGGDTGHFARPKGQKMLSFRAELLNPVVVPIRNVNCAVIVHGYAPRQVHLTEAVTLGAEPTDEFPLLGEFLNPAVEAVYDQKISVGVKRHARRTAELAFSISGFSPGPKEVAVLVEYGDAVKPFIGAIDVFVLVHHYRRKPNELAVIFTAPAILTDEIFVDRDFGNTHRGAVAYVEHAVWGGGYGDRLAEAISRRGPASDVFTVLPAPAGGYCDLRHFEFS